MRDWTITVRVMRAATNATIQPITSASLGRRNHLERADPSAIVEVSTRGDRPGKYVRNLHARCYDSKMTRASRDLLNEALQLPLDDRAEMAAELLESLDVAENDVEAAWAAEIERRIAAARAGEIESTDWRVVLDRVEKEVLRR